MSQTVVRMQQGIAEDMNIIDISDGNTIPVRLDGRTKRNAMALGAMRLADG